MEFRAVQEAYENATKPLWVRREAWQEGDFAKYDGLGVVKSCSKGETCDLDEEDFEATDWKIEVAIPLIGDVD